MADSFMNSLVNKTSPAPYDQLVVLSQQTINNAFYNMWALADDSSPIRSLNISTRDGETIKATLNAPTVILNVVDYSCTMYFQWNFASGKMTLYTTDDPNNPTTQCFDVTGWTVAFATVMTRDTVQKSDPNYKGYVNAMGLGPNDVFTLGRLYVKSQETPGYYPEGSNFGGIDWSTQPQPIQEHFQELRAVWMTDMMNGNLTNVGVQLMTTDPTSINQSAPTFPPSTIDYLTYPWKDPDNPQPATNMLASNALCYLIETGNDTGPSPPLLPYSGTWVSTAKADPGRDAILCINTKQFWEAWLLPQLQAINMASQIQPTQPYIAPYTSDGISLGFRFAPGTCTAYPDSTNAYYQFNTASDGNGWTWAANNNNLLTNDSLTNGSKFNVTQSSTANSKVIFGHGVNTITITGNNSVHGQCECDDGWTSTMDFTMTYTVQLAVVRVDNGGLQILNAAAPACNPGTPQYNPDGQDWQPPWNQYGQTVQDGAFSIFQQNIQTYDNALLSGLAGQNKLYLPGSGEYLCSKVMFSGNGDLLTNLAFNGASASSKKLPHTPVVVRGAVPVQPLKPPFVAQVPQVISSYISTIIPKQFQDGAQEIHTCKPAANGQANKTNGHAKNNGHSHKIGH